jgi:glutamate---cysteine ligase / carboxylate-amine ligase
MDEMLEVIAEDAVHFGSVREVSRAREIAGNGTSADRQRQVFHAATKAGQGERAALAAVVEHLIAEFHEDL